MSVLCLDMSADYVCQILWPWVYVLKNCTSSKLAHLYLIQRQNSRYFRCPVWKTKSW